MVPKKSCSTNNCTKEWFLRGTREFGQGRKKTRGKHVTRSSFSLSFSSRPSINLCTTSKLRLMSYHMEDDVSRWRIGMASPDKRIVIGAQEWASNNASTTNDDRSFCPACSSSNYIYVSYSRAQPRHVYSVIEKLVPGLDFFLEMSCVPPDATWNNFTRSRARNPLLGIDYSFETSFTSR